MKLLTPASANSKLAKNNYLNKYYSFILHLAPHTMSGIANVCTKASKGCIFACLNTAGRGQFNSVQAARIRKTKWLFQDREGFLKALRDDLRRVQQGALIRGLEPVVRLNGTSDLDWTDIITEFPNIQFYDYTKVFERLTHPRPANYHLTFSRTERNEAECLKALQMGINVAVVFKGAPAVSVFGVPSVRIIDGDEHDLRFLDHGSPNGLGAIVALKAKGRAKKDTTGFVHPGFEASPREILLAKARAYRQKMEAKRETK